MSKLKEIKPEKNKYDQKLEEVSAGMIALLGLTNETQKTRIGR